MHSNINHLIFGLSEGNDADHKKNTTMTNAKINNDFMNSISIENENIILANVASNYNLTREELVNGDVKLVIDYMTGPSVDVIAPMFKEWAFLNFIFG